MVTWDLVSQLRRRVRDEVGIARKAAHYRIALCYPAVYAVGMSSLGYQTIYREINLHPGVAAERAFLPEHPEHYRQSRSPVITYESESPLGSFPVIAFSIAYELEITGILEILDLCGIPLLRTERDQRHPLIVAGGPLTVSNPVILSPFVDLIILGEGEELIHTFLEAAMELGKGSLLDKFSTLPGCYVPGISGQMPQPARVGDARLPAYSQIITKNAVLASMFLIEPIRGCSHRCAYCVMRRSAGRGVRIVPAEKAFSLIPPYARRVGLVGAAVADHPGIKELIGKIVDSGREIGVSSLRADRLDADLVRLLAKGGFKTLTVAADGLSQRLRNLIGRDTTENHLIHAAELVREARLQRLKIYAMIGLLGERMNDIDEFIRLCLELSQIAPLSLSIAPFVPKRNTPLADAGFESVQSLNAKLSRLRSGIKGRAQLLVNSPRWGWVEYMLSQGGEEAGLAAMDAWKAGGSFLSWKRAFDRREVRTGLRNAADGEAKKLRSV